MVTLQSNMALGMLGWEERKDFRWRRVWSGRRGVRS
jgi:hypothetical protein